MYVHLCVCTSAAALDMHTIANRFYVILCTCSPLYFAVSFHAQYSKDKFPKPGRTHSRHLNKTVQKAKAEARIRLSERQRRILYLQQLIIYSEFMLLYICVCYNNMACARLCACAPLRQP